jgi:diguanylate cyclase (GGDEF)-like protein
MGSRSGTGAAAAKSAESWSTLQLAEFVALVSDSVDERDAMQRAVERAAEALEAEVCVLTSEGRVLAAIGFPADELPEAELVETVARRRETVGLPGLGELWTLAKFLDREGGSALLAARLGSQGFSQEESDLLRGMARSLQLTLRMVRTLDQERELRRQSQREVRQRKKAERELAHQALHDGLTGLPNRVLLRDRVVQALDRTSDSSAVVAVLVVDVDHFKLANDSLGHRLGDQLLLLLGQRLERSVAAPSVAQRSYTVARIGGDQFAVLCEELGSEHEAITVAHRIQGALRTPFVLEGRRVSLSASMGIAMAGSFAGLGRELMSADELLRDAEVAVSRAKERGGDCYEVFDEQMRVRLFERLQLESELRDALTRDQLRLVYQPVVAVEDGAMVSLEALVRWEHPRRGTLLPGEFVSVAEESELIVPLGEWVLEEACRQLARWRESHRGGSAVRVSVNVSARQLTPSLVDIVSRTLSRSGIQPAQLALEITETLLIEQADTSRAILESLKQLGVGILLDDFGTGYSSLSYLKSFSLDQLKVDRSFIAELSDDARSAKIVSATIEMARALGMTVVAEGVETASQLEVLQRLGCDYAQGDHFSEPQPPDAIGQLIDQALAQRPTSRAPIEPAAAPSQGGGVSLETPGEAEVRRRVAVGRVAGLLFCGGGLMTVPINLILNHPPGALVVAGLTLLSLTSGAACLLAPWRRLSWRWLHFTAVVATAEVALSVWAENRLAVFSWFYVLVAAALGYAFADRRKLAAHVAVVGGAMALPLIYSSDPLGDAVPRTLLGIAVVAVTVALVAWLREQLEVNQAELRELASRDPLTGVGNYRLLHERLEYELRRHQRAERQLAILLIDLDRFKEVNERMGHAAGDEVLRRVGRALTAAVRDQDTVARQGGDEFAVLAPETDYEGARILAGRIRDRLSRVQLAGGMIGATVGFSIYPDDGGSAQLLLARADSRLLSEKARARPRRPPVATRRTAPSDDTTEFVGASSA